MPSPRRTILFIILLLVLSPLSSSSDSPSVYDMLERFNFPKGILPAGAMSYRLDPDGGFEVLLSGDCQFRVNGDGYLLKYRKRITGKVKSGQLKALNGVSVKILFIWIDIDEVLTSGNNLRFFVGPLSASFPSSNFEVCPRCRRGSNCESNIITSTVAIVSMPDS